MLSLWHGALKETVAFVLNAESAGKPDALQTLRDQHARGLIGRASQGVALRLTPMRRAGGLQGEFSVIRSRHQSAVLTVCRFVSWSSAAGEVDMNYLCGGETVEVSCRRARISSNVLRVNQIANVQLGQFFRQGYCVQSVAGLTEHGAD